jgi:type II secretory pathway pseudopilin PulG
MYINFLFNKYMRKKFKAFTLVEMLIVMGIIIILMAVGITAGRYAINRANDVAHQNAVDNFYTALQAYYADNREFPRQDSLPANGFADMLDSTNSAESYYIGEYMDEGAFDGGTEATYYYATDDLGQEVIVCVSLFGQAVASNERMGDYYCNGNAFGTSATGIPSIDDKVVSKTVSTETEPVPGGFDIIQQWDGSDWEAISS